ncbi:VanZ family protein [Mesorhizobium sp. ES1-1]|uniref:VanZ family protein n=1 Tax=Mesorhizobium sp. ES1-1 TaxID=2876629 RepID=UPI001CCA0EB0|nr:hypothetical protein [Mesorhizobium sp. ES1-1]MBZ9674131.1 hypothetical protein [Mesorhizobium sp. ES1-1]
MKLYAAVERAAFIFALIAVFVLALLPASRLEQFGLNIGFHSDKLNHASAFAVLAFLGTLGWPQRKARVVVFLALVGGAIEVLQGTSLIARDLDILDWVADCLGISCGLIAVVCLRRIFCRQGRS